MSKTVGRALLGFLFSAVVSLPAETIETEKSWLPLGRSAFMRILTEGSQTDHSAFRTLDEYVREEQAAAVWDPEKLKHIDETFTKRRGAVEADDTIWIALDTALPFWVTMAGSDQKVHTISVTVPVVNLSREAGRQAFDTLGNLFEALYPDWPEAATWPDESIRRAWENHPLARKTPLTDPNDVYVRYSQSGITSTTFGVPPDIVVYTVTVRERCIPTAEQGNPFQRLIC